MLTVCLDAVRGQVRCCSDTQLSGAGWLKHADAPPYAYGCSVWGGVTSECKENQNLAQAEAICDGAGARLCTVPELEAGCAAHTGCGFDRQLVWAGPVG